MRKLICLTSLFLACISNHLLAQEILPRISVKNINNRIIISWRNQYPLSVKNINIQRSYDSLRNFSTIGSVLNPQNEENGYADENTPYNKMYYRVFISFDGGNYIFSESVRPVKESFQQPTVNPPSQTFDPVITSVPRNNPPQPSVNRPNPADSGVPVDSARSQLDQLVTKPTVSLPVATNTPDLATYPSRRIYTGKDNNVIILLPWATSRKYQVKFFDENEKFLFELSKINEAYLILDKVNFLRSGWYFFEIFENGKRIEKNRFFIPKDVKQ